LLLLRVVLGLTALYRSWDGFVISGGIVAAGLPVMGVLLGLAGMALFAGLGTRPAALLAGIVLMSEMLWVGPGRRGHSMDQFLTIMLSESMAFAIALLGPGAFSIDSRKWGRREIVITPSQRKS
jgi:uncharacterized membrane protein YphA (DoxX/SURF4 family)